MRAKWGVANMEDIEFHLGQYVIQLKIEVCLSVIS